MEPTFRKSMAWLHTWAGVVIGSLLFAIFWMGTLSVFDREIDRWMMPATRLSPAALQQPVKLDGAITEQAQLLTQGAPQWFIRLPSERMPAVELRWRNARGDNERRYLHPANRRCAGTHGNAGGHRLHFPVPLQPAPQVDGRGLLAGGAGGHDHAVACRERHHHPPQDLCGLLLFRPKKHLQRASLDLHNLTGVLAMPFHFVIALSGIVILFSIYWPSAHHAAYPQAKDARQAFLAEGFGQYRRAKANTTGQPLASLDAMLASAEAQWQGGQANFIRVWHPGDANSYVELRRSHADTVTMNLDQLYLDAATGSVLKRFDAAPVMTVQRFISGLHFIQFERWLLRWLYFLGGLSGCVLIATGFLFWLESRRASHAKKAWLGCGWWRR
ncbi:PepSY domain-containing protein [Polaromonas sp. P1(28)-13]|nr:PepSY domain-containing protein [Polaromonas sp. P1(28)-13]